MKAFARLSEALHDGNEREICALFILVHLQIRHAQQWLSGPRRKRLKTTGELPANMDLLTLSRRQTERLSGLLFCSEIFTHYFLRGVVLDAHEGFCGWNEGRYPLLLRQDIPSPSEMLDIQCLGRRFVTLMLEDRDQFRSHGRHKNAADFLLHDFEHAHKFFSDPSCFSGQVRFFNLLRSSLPLLRPWCEDPQFVTELDYLKSDMNSHPVHLIKYLKAIVLSAEIRKTHDRQPELDPFWSELFAHWQMNKETLQAALDLNQPERETQREQIRVRDFFMPEFTCRSLSAQAT